MTRKLNRRGYKAFKKEEEQIKKRQEQRKNNLWRFFLGDRDGEDIPILFLTEEPILFYEHNVPSGKGYDNVICTEDDKCPHCKDGNYASYKGAFLIVDTRTFKNSRDEEVSNQVKLLVRGQKDIAKLGRLSSKFGLTNRPYYVTKVGTKQNTTYEFERGEEHELELEEIEEFLETLPEGLLTHADAEDEETLYDIVEHCIYGDVIEGLSFDDDSDEEDDDDDEVDIDNGVIGVGGRKTEKPKSRFSKKPSGKSQPKGKLKKGLTRRK